MSSPKQDEFAKLIQKMNELNQRSKKLAAETDLLMKRIEEVWEKKKNKENS